MKNWVVAIGAFVGLTTIGSASTLGAEAKWVTAPGAVVCPTRNFDDARAAAKAQDQKWLDSTGCMALKAGIPIVIISGHEFSASADHYDETWRVRITPPGGEGVTAYIRGADAELSPESKSAPGRIALIPDNNKSEKAAINYWEEIRNKDRNSFQNLNVRTKYLEKFSTWEIYLRGLTFQEAIEKCAKIKDLKGYCVAVLSDQND